jgi:SAM-dependent methyltransferase
MTPFRDAAYYQDLHDRNANYQNNNWLMDELPVVQSFRAQTLLELACGNGRFLELAAPHFRWVYGCDWAVSPRLQEVMRKYPNVSFFRMDLYKEVPTCQADLVVSADFLEHIAPASLLSVMCRIDGLSEHQLHKVACYDDGNSHLSVMTPIQWLQAFHVVNPAYVLDRTERRLGMANKEIAVFSKGRP